MNTFLKISSAVLMGTVLAVPASMSFAASAPVVTDNATASVNKLPASQLVDELGMGSVAELKPLLSTASAINIIDISNVYAGGLDSISQAIDGPGAAVGAIKTLRTDLAADATVKAWFTTNKLDITKVVAIDFAGNVVNVYMNS